MADIDIFGDEPVVAMVEKEPEDKEEELKKDDDGEQVVKTDGLQTDENKPEESIPEEAIIIPDEKVQDGGVIEDEETNGENGDVSETAVIPAEPAKVAPAEVEPYVSATDTVQVMNVTCKASEEQMSVLFSFVGPIVKIDLYPKGDEMVSNKVAFIQFKNKEDVIVALHLTNTVFIDSALQVTEWTDDWPDDAEAMIYCTPKNAVDNLNLGAGMNPTQAALTLFNNPRLMTTTNKQAADEFRRQVCIGNIHEIVTEEQVQQYFESYAGSVERVEFHELRAGKTTSMDKDDLGHQVRYATLVFKDSSSLGPALQLDGQMFAGIPIIVKHTKYSDIKHDAAPKAASKLASDYSSRKRGRSRSRSGSRRRKRSSSRKKSSSRRRSRSRKRSRSRRSRSRKRSRDRKSRRSRSRSRSKKSKKSHR